MNIHSFSSSFSFFSSMSTEVDKHHHHQTKPEDRTVSSCSQLCPAARNFTKGWLSNKSKMANGSVLYAWWFSYKFLPFVHQSEIPVTLMKLAVRCMGIGKSKKGKMTNISALSSSLIHLLPQWQWPQCKLQRLRDLATFPRASPSLMCQRIRFLVQDSGNQTVPQQVLCCQQRCAVGTHRWMTNMEQGENVLCEPAVGGPQCPNGHLVFSREEVVHTSLCGYCWQPLSLLSLFSQHLSCPRKQSLSTIACTRPLSIKC